MIGECPICHRWLPLERHHIFGGSCRRKSEQYGLVIGLCHWCHNEPPRGAHHNSQTALALHQYGQRKWMEEQGKTIDDFRREFGINYL